jgi:HD-like signal output (HDOD) protein
MQTLNAQSAPSIDAVVKEMRGLSTLPHIAAQVVRIANDPDAGAKEMKAVLEADVTLTVRLLRCVNSSAYALRTPINNLQQAITYVGINQVRNLAVTASVSDLFKKDETICAYRRRMLWRHLVAVAIASRLLAMRRNLANFEDVFLAGLLHDLGIILEDQQLHDDFRRTMQCLDESRSLPEVEQIQFGFDHTQLGYAVAKRWNFPEVALAAIRHHHQSAACRGVYLDSVRCVEVANFIVSLKGITSVGMNLVRAPIAALQGLSLQKEDLLVLGEDLDREMVVNDELFQL